MTAILGVLAMLVSLSVVLFGLTAQAWKNLKRKTCEGLSLTLMLITLLAYSVWGAYGFSKPDWFLVASQIPGAILALIIVLQCLFYDYLPARRRQQKEMWKGELDWVQGQIDVITREQTNMRKVLTKTATDPQLSGDEGRDQRQSVRSDELRENGILLGQMVERRKQLHKKLGLVSV